MIARTASPRLLLDQNLSFKLYQALADLFPGSSQARLLGLNRASDEELWRRAGADGYVLVTQDADFAELSALLGPPPKVVWLRIGNSATATVEAALRRNAEAITALSEDDAATCLEIRG